MFEDDALVHYDNRLFLAQTLDHGQKTGHISAEQVDQTHQDVATLAHKLITIKVENLSSRAEIRGQIQDAFTLVSLGLEYGCHGELDKAVRLLPQNRLIKFFQIGNTVMDKLEVRAQATLEKAVLVSPEMPMPRVMEQEEIPIYNEWEREFLVSISERRLTINAPQITLQQAVTTPRVLTSLADVSIANTQLDYLEYRLRYLQALPQEKIFAATYLPDSDGDIARQITTALMSNLVLYREVDFHQEPNDLNNFRDIAYDDDLHAIKKASRDLLIGWIEHYMDLTAQSEEIREYATEYWRNLLNMQEMQWQQEEST